MKVKKIQRILNVFIVVWAAVLVAFLAILVTNDTALSRVLGLATQARPILSPIPTVAPLATNTPIPTSTPPRTVKQRTVQTALTTDPDPIITCTFHYLPSKQMRRSECQKTFECQIGGQWYIYTSRDKCSQDQNAYWKNYYSVSNGSTGTTTTYPPCTINFPYTGPQTYYYMTAEECSAEKTKVASLGQSGGAYATPTLSPEQQQALIDQQAQQYNNKVQQCQNDVTYKYSGLLQSCNQYGGSTRDACIKIYTDERQREYDACG